MTFIFFSINENLEKLQYIHENCYINFNLISDLEVDSFLKKMKACNIKDTECYSLYPSAQLYRISTKSKVQIDNIYTDNQINLNINNIMLSKLKKEAVCFVTKKMVSEVKNECENMQNGDIYDFLRYIGYIQNEYLCETGRESDSIMFMNRLTEKNININVSLYSYTQYSKNSDTKLFDCECVFSQSIPENLIFIFPRFNLLFEDERINEYCDPRQLSTYYTINQDWWIPRDYRTKAFKLEGIG